MKVNESKGTPLDETGHTLENYPMKLHETNQSKLYASHTEITIQPMTLVQ
jgi:hypothetical protein